MKPQTSLYYRLGIACMAILLAGQVWAQNVIQNGDFEIMLACPDTTSLLQLADGWFEANIAKADYFNTCDVTGVVSTPTNYIGSEIPHSGNGYAGIYIAEESGPIYREFIQTEITEPLIKNHAYQAEAYVSIADESTCYPSAFCIYLTSDSLMDTISNGFNTQMTLYEQILCTEPQYPISTKEGWYHVSFCFIATGNEHFLTVGNNYSEAVAPCVGSGGMPAKAYIFVDDIAVQPMPIQTAYTDTFFCKGSSVTLDVSQFIEQPLNVHPVVSWTDGPLGSVRTFTQEGVYTALIDNGCAVDTVRVGTHWIYDCPEIFYFPNAFSPNNDGVNDIYRVQSENVTVDQLDVYDRWGSLVYSGTQNPTGWDGTINNKPADVGVYVYVLRYTTNISGITTNKCGTLQLIR